MPASYYEENEHDEEGCAKGCFRCAVAVCAVVIIIALVLTLKYLPQR